MFRFIKPRAATIRTRLQPNVSSLIRFRKAPIKAKNIAITFIASKHIPDEEFQEVEPPLFIPFPGTTKQLPVIPYKGTDPEFQEFIRLSKDAKLLDKLRADLAEFMRNFASKTTVLRAIAGKSMKTRRVWLDIDFPSTPPPSFERSGIEISDDAISWVTQPVDAFNILAAEEFKSIAEIFGVQVPTSPAQQSIGAITSVTKISQGNEWTTEGSWGIQGPLTAKDGPPQQPLGDKSKEIGDAASPGKPNLKEDILPALANSVKDIHSSFAKPIMAAKVKLCRDDQEVATKAEFTSKRLYQGLGICRN
ncbi:hypothetical protein DID88_000247 [Monilinia fructigena]|uniref:Uncharacterized protein n=1 Tax=Monilinia fructigena TaxID=38457 RepID=A0A395IJC3_9HELO|nr:hypothetical protein DID88_000247 [Monilinia fructigena]